MNDIHLSFGALRAASADATNASQGVATARSASNDALSFNAFGLMCSPLLLPPYMLVKAAADLSMDSAAQALTRTADRLLRSAIAFEEAEETNAKALKGLAGAVCGPKDGTIL